MRQTITFESMFCSTGTGHALESAWICSALILQERHRIDRRPAIADFKVELRRRDAAGLPGLGDHLAAFDGFATLDQQLAQMRVGCCISVGMPHGDEMTARRCGVARVGY